MTKIYGDSDDLIEFEGDVTGEVGCYGTNDKDRGVLIVCSDGSLLEAKYGKDDQGIWEIKILNMGSLFKGILICNDPMAKIHSDAVQFNDGLKWAYAATGYWERVR